MTLISGFVNGMDSAVQDNVTLYSGGHVLISGYTASRSGRLQNRFADEKIAAIIEGSDQRIVTISPLAQTRATAVFGTREIQLAIRGVDWRKDQLYHHSLILSKGNWQGMQNARTILMSAQTADRFGASVGDRVAVRLTTASGQQNITDYSVAAIYDDRAAGGMNTAFVSLSDLVSDLNMNTNEYQEIAVFLRDGGASEDASKKIIAALSAQGYKVGRGQASFAGDSSPGASRYRVVTVQDLAGEIGSALGSIRWIGYAIFAIMLIVSATGISNSYRMILLERTKEIGMLRCIGYKKKDVFSSFIAEGILLAGGAALAGVLLAVPLGFGIGLINLNPYSDFGSALAQGHLLFEPTFVQLILIICFVTLVAIAAVYFPARKAAEIVPVEALRKIA